MSGSPPPPKTPFSKDETPSESAFSNASPRLNPGPGTTWPSTFRRWFVTAIRFLVLLILTSWGTLALFYSNLPWKWSRFLLAFAFAAFSIRAQWLGRKRYLRFTFPVLFLAVLVWFACISPSHNRRWRQEVAVLPRAVIDGDHVKLSGVRDFEYRSRNEFTARYIERELSLSHLTGVDFFLSYWKPGRIAHTFVSFDFDNAPPVCISIEIRPEEGESFSSIPALFKQFELIYVLGNETDLVRLRTNYRGEEVYLYPIRVSTEAARRLFLVYLDRINRLAEEPEFYNLLSNNCTVNIVRYSNAAGRHDAFDIRFLLNGLVDRYIYEAGLVDTSLSFEELRRRSRITDIARSAASDSSFSKRIRESARAQH